MCPVSPQSPEARNSQDPHAQMLGLHSVQEVYAVAVVKLKVLVAISAVVSCGSRCFLASLQLVTSPLRP